MMGMRHGAHAAPIWPFICKRCGQKDCTNGGEYKGVFLCLPCYTYLHKTHKSFDERCYLCWEDEYWRFWRD